MNHWILLLTSFSDLSLTSQVNSSVSNYILNNLSFEISKTTSLHRDFFFKWSLYCRSINEFQPKSDLGHWMESTLGVQCTIYSAVHQYSMLVDVHRLPVFPLYLGKNTSVLPVLHILHRSLSWNLICHLLFCYCCWFGLVCLFFLPQKRKEQLPHFQSIKISIPTCMVNIRLYLALLFPNLMI